MGKLCLALLLLCTQAIGQQPADLAMAKKIYQGLQKLDFPATDSAKAQLKIAYNHIGNASDDSSNYYTAAILYEKSWIEYKQSNYQQAIDDGLKANEKVNKISAVKLQQKIYYHLGNCYAKIGSSIAAIETDKQRATQHLEKSRYFLDRSLSLARSVSDSSLIVQSMAAIANYFVSRKQYDSAEHFSRMIIANTTANNHKSLGTAYNLLGIVAFEKGNFDEAGMFFQQTIEQTKQVPGSLTLLSAMGNLANVHMEQKKYDLARQELHQLIQLNTMAQRKQALSKNYITLHNMYKRMKQYDSALFYSEKYYVYKDSILSETNKAALQELEIKYAATQKENELAALRFDMAKKEADMRKRNTWVISIAAVLLLAAAIAYFLFRQRMLKQKQLTAEMKQQLLTAQMNPHFLFNSLNSIQRLYVDGRIEEGNEFMGQFARFVREILEKTARNRIPLFEEVEFLQAYLDLEKKRLGNKFDYRISIPDELRNSFYKVPSLIFQPLAENALLHGIMPKDEKGFIDISVQQQNDAMLIFTVKDDGIGYNTSQQKKTGASHISKGMELIRSRLGKKGLLTITPVMNERQAEQGTIATMLVPV